MEKIYLASTFSRKDELTRYRSQLQAAGYKVTSSWLDQTEGDAMPHGLDAAAREGLLDLVDISNSDTMVLFTGVSSTTGGYHTELGVALTLGLIIYIVGPRENVFHYQDRISGQFDRWEDFTKPLDL